MTTVRELESKLAFLEDVAAHSGSESVPVPVPSGPIVPRAIAYLDRWEVPLELSGPTYNQQPLVYAALAAQKHYNALYLNCVSAERTR